jgi:hypothetical protein
MNARRPVIYALVALLIAAAAGAVCAEAPEAGGRERHWYLVRATKEFEARRFGQALVSFEAAARLAEEPLPDDALRRWGIAASEAGWPLSAYVRLRQYQAAVPAAPDREALQTRIVKARRTLLATAVRQSRVIVLTETRPSWESPGDRQIIRLVARRGRATVEALSGARVAAPTWERAGEIEESAYVALVSQLLDSPALLEEWPPQVLDPNESGPRRAVVLRLVLGEEERVRQALRGEPYESLAAVAQTIFEFSRTVSLSPPEKEERAGRP